MITRDLEVWTGTPDDTSEPDDMIRVTFAVPTPMPDQEDCWNCELRIDAFATTRVHVIAGIDGMQAFRLAMRFAEAELGFLARRRGVTITFLGRDHLFGPDAVQADQT